MTLKNCTIKYLINQVLISILEEKREYKESIKKYIKCHKKNFREYKEDEEQKRTMVRKARESLETLRECLLDMNFECFAETEQGSEIVSLEEKARKIYQETIDEVREKIDQEKKCVCRLPFQQKCIFARLEHTGR